MSEIILGTLIFSSSGYVLRSEIAGLPQWLSGKESTHDTEAAGNVGLIPGQEDPLEEGMATHKYLAWRIPWTEDTGGLQSMGSQRVRHD